MGQVRPKWLSLALLLTAVLCYPADTAPTLEFRVKAAFLLNFVKFVDWPAQSPPPEGSPPPLALCIIGEDPFGSTLDQLVLGESVGSRKIIVQRHPSAPQTRCDAAYIATPLRDVPRTIETLGPGVLTIGEGEPFLRSGGIIAFVIDNRRVRFDVNQTAARNAAVRISSRLLSVARVVEK